MSSKLDQSLDEIAGGRRGVNSNKNRRARKPAVAAPVGGIAKKTANKPTRATPIATKAAATLPARGPSKIIVSNLPDDVTEQQIKEYFSSTVGQVRSALINYTKTGKSTGVATIVFTQSHSAAEAAKTYNGVKVDNRPMRIEVIVDAGSVAAPPAPKGLKDRIATPKNGATGAKPKAVGGKPANGVAAAGGDKAGGRRAKKPKNARPKKKTAEELDADMADYFEPGTSAAAPAAATNGAVHAAATANGGEAAMEDEIM